MCVPVRVPTHFVALSSAIYKFEKGDGRTCQKQAFLCTTNMAYPRTGKVP